MIEQGLSQLIQSDPGVGSIVATANGAGVYWILVPKGAAVPCVVLTRVATDETNTTQGSLEFRGALFQADCISMDKYEVRRLSKIVRRLVTSFKGTLPDGTFVSGALTSKDWDMPYEEGAKGFVYRSMLEFRMWYQES